MLAAVVRDLGAAGTVEFPPGKVLFRTDGWISNLRFSPAGDRIAFLHHPVRNDDMGEPMVVDLHGQSKVLGPRWPRVLGLAWTPEGSEVLFTAGRINRNVLVAVTDGTTRELYTSPADLRVEDVAPDGAVLVTEQLERTEIALSTAGKGEQSILTWGNWAIGAGQVSDQGTVLFSESVPVPVENTQTPTQPVWSFLRRADRNAAQILGIGASHDLSPDGRSALVNATADRRTLTVLPVGPGQSKPLQTQGMEVSAVRWFRDGRRLLCICREASAGDFHLFVLPQDGSPATRLSDAPVISRRVLHLSPDDRWAATLDANENLVLVSTKDGSVYRLPEAGPDAVPRGWSAEGHLWVTRGGDRTPARARLLRFDVERHRLLEERTVGPTDTNGTIYLRDVAISPDGHSTVFVYSRNLGYLYVLRGLLRPK